MDIDCGVKSHKMKANKAEIAEFFGVSLPTVHSWLRKGCPGRKKGNRWQFDTAKVFGWYRDAMNSDAGDLDLTKERALLTRAQRKLKQIDIKIRNGEYISAEEVGREWCNIAANVRAKLLNLPSKMAAEVAAESNRGRCQQILKKQVYEALTELSQGE